MKKNNLETRNIFTRRGRLNRRIDKHKKLCEKIGALEEYLAVLNGRLYGNENQEECIIRCDQCGHEFDIVNKDIEIIECDKTTEDGSQSICKQFVCPKCGFKNEVDEDNSDLECEEKLDESIAKAFNELAEETIPDNQNNELSEDEFMDSAISDDSKNIINDFLDNEMPTKEKIPKKKSKVIEINNKNNNKSHKVVINKSNPVIYLTDNRITDAISIAIKHETASKTINMLSKKGISMIQASDKNIIGYSTDTGDITLACDKTDKESMSIFNITTKLAIMPTGKYKYVNDSILSQLGIEKISDKCEEIGLPGKAYIVKLRDDSLAAFNFSFKQNDVTMTIIYDINKN